jgi:hypothetical protein
MALDLTKFVRLLIFASLSTLATTTWTNAQGDPEDPRGLYEAHGPGTRPPATPKEGAFRRRVPESTTSRFAPHFRRYMGESEDKNFDDHPAGVKGRPGSRLPGDFADDLDIETETGTESETGFQSALTKSRFSEQDRETRHDAYQKYLKERDPAKRAQLYRDYLGKKSQSPTSSTGDRSSPFEILNSSRSATSTEPPGFGLNRGSSTRNGTLPSSGIAPPRGSLFPSSRANTPTPPGLFRRSDEPAASSSTGSASRRPPSRSSGSAGRNLEDDRDR